MSDQCEVSETKYTSLKIRGKVASSWKSENVRHFNDTSILIFILKDACGVARMVSG